jgi:hypothetical protein
MAESLRVDLFAEDKAHEALLEPLIRRLARDSDLEVIVSLRSPLGGYGRMLLELGVFQKAVRSGQPGLQVPDILVIGRDTNCEAFTRARQTVRNHIDHEVFPSFAVACPEPHIERWFLADPVSFQEVVGADPRPGRRKCQRDLYKERLADAIRRGGNPATLGGIEFATDLVKAMDLYRAARAEPSLRHFINELRQAFALLSMKEV